jgi:hypothetical protein
VEWLNGPAVVGRKGRGGPVREAGPRRLKGEDWAASGVGLRGKKGFFKTFFKLKHFQNSFQNFQTNFKTF